MKLTNLFKSKDNRLKNAFRTIKTDMDFINENHDALKNSTNEWIMFLNQDNQDLKERVQELEKKLDLLDHAFDEQRLSVLRSI